MGDSPGFYQGQQDDFTRTMLSITILRTDIYNPHRGRGKICMMLLHIKRKKTKLSVKCHPYDTRLDLVTFHTKDNWSDGTSKIDLRTYDNVKTTGA